MPTVRSSPVFVGVTTVLVLVSADLRTFTTDRGPSRSTSSQRSAASSPWRIPVRRARVSSASSRVPLAACKSLEASSWSRAGGQVDLAGARRLRPTGAGALLRGGPPSAVGEPAARPAVDAVPDAPGFRGTLGGGRHPGEGAETVREIAGTAQRAPLGSGEALPGTQEGHLIRPRRREEEFRDGHKARRETPTVK